MKNKNTEVQQYNINNTLYESPGPKQERYALRAAKQWERCVITESIELKKLIKLLLAPRDNA